MMKGWLNLWAEEGKDGKADFFNKMVFSLVVSKQPRSVEAVTICTLNLAKKGQTSMHNKVTLLVDAILEAKKKLANAHSDKEKYYYGNKCLGLDRNIDEFVYAFCDLTTDQIKNVEAAN